MLNTLESSPEKLYGKLFAAVQLSGIYTDSKTFVDLIPRIHPKKIMARYEIDSQQRSFNLTEFIKAHFHNPREETPETPAEQHETIIEHIDHLWKQLTKVSKTDQGSLIALPHPYIVPGGRFGEQFYWDNYFVMLGLAADNNWTPIEQMIKNYAFMIKEYGFIPNANRTYFLSRSQPPFFALMIQLLSKKKGKQIYVEYLPALIAEHTFWMKRGNREATEANLRTVLISNEKGIMNRFYDNQATPRPESHIEDVNTAYNSKDKPKIYRNLRAAAESGWDFSSRWLKNPEDLSSILTTDIIPVDLNSLLYTLETTIAEAYKIVGDDEKATLFTQKAKDRAANIKKLMWDKKTKFFYDYNHVTEQQMPHLTLAGIYPLFAGISTQEEADGVAKIIESRFLLSGGVATTLQDTDQQWDYPNGWAPLQWVTIAGLRRYNHDELADKIKEAWMSSVEAVFMKERKLVEKYNVANNIHTGGGGGEYPLQDGFGWTNGVYRALYSNFRP